MPGPKTCYMFEKMATTREHVPPQGLFPEIEAFKAIGIEIGDMRKNLITVPSCPEHNNDKSNDDAFLISILVMNYGANEIGQNQFKAKVLKSFEIDLTLPNQFQVDLTEVVVEDDKRPFKTYAMTGDVDRFK